MNEHLETLNALTRCLQKFDEQALEDFHTVFDTVWPETPEEVLCLAENLHDFAVVPDISSAEEYGWFLITKSEHFDIDPKLEDCIDYQKYGQRRIQEEGGRFGDRGYVAYLGAKPEIRSLMDRNLSERQTDQSLTSYSAKNAAQSIGDAYGRRRGKNGQYGGAETGWTTERSSARSPRPLMRGLSSRRSSEQSTWSWRTAIPWSPG